MRGGIAVVALREVPVVTSDDGIRDAILHVLTIPLPDARTAGVGQHPGTEGLEVGQQPVAFDGGPDLFGTGGN